MDQMKTMVAEVAALAGRVPGLIEGANPWALILITALAAGVGVGAVARHAELGWFGKGAVASLLFLFVFGLGLALSTISPVLVDMGDVARGQATPHE